MDKTRDRTPLELMADQAGWGLGEWRLVARLIVEKGVSRDNAIRLLLGLPEE
jgi:hypothetical protein